MSGLFSWRIGKLCFRKSAYEKHKLDLTGSSCIFLRDKTSIYSFAIRKIKGNKQVDAKDFRPIN